MSAVKEKIAKLLALSNSPNEKEAQAALLKARELMARHKLRPEECQEGAAARGEKPICQRRLCGGQEVRP